jgi:hypothetical protein
VWDTKTGTATRVFVGHTNWVRDVAFNADATRLASRDDGGKAKVWDIVTGREILHAPVPDWFDAERVTARSPDGKWIAVPQIDGTILLVKLVPNEFELGYRAWFARPDPDWHWVQAEKYEKEQSWFAAAFHCDQVLKSRPDDAAAKARLATAREHLKKP